MTETDRVDGTPPLSGLSPSSIEQLLQGLCTLFLHASARYHETAVRTLLHDVRGCETHAWYTASLVSRLGSSFVVCECFSRSRIWGTNPQHATYCTTVDCPIYRFSMHLLANALPQRYETKTSSTQGGLFTRITRHLPRVRKGDV